MQGRHVSRGCWGFSGWVLWAWTVGFKGTLGLACEPRSPVYVRPMWPALGTLFVFRVVSWAWALGFAFMFHCIHSVVVVVRFSGPLLLGRLPVCPVVLGFRSVGSRVRCQVVVVGRCSIVYELPRAGP